MFESTKTQKQLRTNELEPNTFNTLIQDVLDNNPWGCTAYTSAGVNKPAVGKTS